MRIFKKIHLVLLLCFVLALAACTSNEETAGGKKGGDLVFLLASDAPTLDPHGSNDTATTNATSQIFERLVEYDENGKLAPALATEFKQLDELNWEFKLRQGVKFHDGTDFNAEAVKITFDRILDPEFASPRVTVVNMIEEVIVKDEYTVVVKTKNPFAPLATHLAHNAGSIISPKAIQTERDGGLKVTENPVGTGAFKYVSWEAGNEIKFERYEDYWGNKTSVDTLTIKIVPEQATRVAMLETGEAHAMLVGPSDVNRVEQLAGVTVNRIKSTRMDYVGFNLGKKPFDNKKVRQAISMALKKEDIVDGILDGNGLMAVGPLAPLVTGSSTDLNPLAYDVEGAKALLAEAGFPNGFKTTLMVDDGNKERTDIAELVQSQLAQIGIEVAIEKMVWATYLEKTAAGEHEMFVLGWTAVTADADYGLYAPFHSTTHGGPGNRTFYSNPVVDDLLDRARQSTDQNERNDLYKQISEILVDDVPMVFTHHQDFNFATNGIASGAFCNFNGTPFFKDVVLN
ncbi:glutathione ABC transporter substrate-binding protein [Anaerobacillus alkaliphilus]|uniref:Glutathione ABC transporter substrate-binding protein n=1 Tax=Anaerobacillus alkaliphilus TaxID=1548597 RepID=A0A4Q0VU64_9BACI|nr:glutathione ABC transporter substrate-binding protein [Anaerobacillus alkaliphilus]RXJ01721.1 glutathione ABC transporter substrate-binding protein [Anaerobacillus alkaliphilus]